MPELPLDPEENGQYPPLPRSYDDDDAYWDWVDNIMDRRKERLMQDMLDNTEGP